MAADGRGAGQPLVGGRVAHGELREEVLSLELELAERDGDRRARRAPADLRGVERVAATIGLGEDGVEVPGDRGERLGVPAEPLELRVAAVAPGLAVKHRLREESLPPEGDEPTGVEMLGMQRPEAHAPLSQRPRGVAAS